MCKIFAVSGGYFARLTCACTLLYHSSTFLDPWQKLVNKSNLDCTSLDWGLQNSSNRFQIVSNFSSSLAKPQDTYWSIPKSPLQAMTFLHCCVSGSTTSLYSSMFFHFNCHFKNLWIQAVINCPVHFGSLYVGHEHTLHYWIGCLLSAWMEWDFIFWLMVRACAFLKGTGYIYFLIRDCRGMSFSWILLL